MQDIKEDDINLYKISIDIGNGKTVNNVYMIKVRRMKYIMTYGKKLSSNFLVNIYYLITFGSCREIQCKQIGSFRFSTKTSDYVRSERVAKGWFPFFKDQMISSLKEDKDKNLSY